MWAMTHTQVRHVGQDTLIGGGWTCGPGHTYWRRLDMWMWAMTHTQVRHVGQDTRRLDMWARTHAG